MKREGESGDSTTGGREGESGDSTNRKRETSLVIPPQEEGEGW